MILIKDMAMPTRCAECRLKDFYYAECNAKMKSIRGFLAGGETKPEWCPLTEVESYGPEGTLYKEK